MSQHDQRDEVERIHDALFITPYVGKRPEKDALGEEPRDMLLDRIARSVLHFGDEYKGQRLPYEKRQGPVFRSEREWRETAFIAELEQLEEKHDCWLEGDYWPNWRGEDEP
jgi:hypothetical protein